MDKLIDQRIGFRVLLLGQCFGNRPDVRGTVGFGVDGSGRQACRFFLLALNDRIVEDGIHHFLICRRRSNGFRGGRLNHWSRRRHGFRRRGRGEVPSGLLRRDNLDAHHGGGILKAPLVSNIRHLVEELDRLQGTNALEDAGGFLGGSTLHGLALGDRRGALLVQIFGERLGGQLGWLLGSQLASQSRAPAQ